MTLQIYNYNDEELLELATSVQKDGFKIFHGQELNKKQIIRLFKRFGELEAPGLFMNPKEYPEIFLVTDQRDPDGKKLGMFGAGELGWHSNGNSRHNVDKILIGLYGVKSDPNTTLSICNTSKPFYALSEEEQEYWKRIKIKIQFQNDTMYHLDEDDPELEFMSANKGSLRKLVGVHPYTGEYYFYFPYHFITDAWEGSTRIDHKEMIKKLKNIVFKPEYQTHHIIYENDLLFMDQFTSLHRRTPVQGPRILWRLAGDYTNIMPSEKE